MNTICDDLRGEILGWRIENRYVMSMVSKEWNAYCSRLVRVVDYYKDFKELCRVSDMLSIVRSYNKIHSNVVIYYVYAFANIEILRFVNETYAGFLNVTGPGEARAQLADFAPFTQIG